MRKLSDTQQALINDLKSGLRIEYFRGIGTRFSSGAKLINENGQQVKVISKATFKSLRDKNLLSEYSRESYHSIYILK